MKMGANITCATKTKRPLHPLHHARAPDPVEWFMHLLLYWLINKQAIAICKRASGVKLCTSGWLVAEWYVWISQRTCVRIWRCVFIKFLTSAHLLRSSPFQHYIQINVSTPHRRCTKLCHLWQSPGRTGENRWRHRFIRSGLCENQRQTTGEAIWHLQIPGAHLFPVITIHTLFIHSNTH